MTTPKSLAEQQQYAAITAPAPLFVRACPGAGKTHVIISRHLASPAPLLRHGRALLSFTRAASQQMRRRCFREGRADATVFPHYIGTLDAFIWDLLVQPLLPTSRTWRLLDSWDRLSAPVKLDREVELGSFPFSYDPATDHRSIRQELLKQDVNRVIAGSRFPWSRWERQAFSVQRDLFSQGYVTGYETRILALRALRERGEVILGPLRSRFAEIIIDEAQDCSVTDLAILQSLHTAGLPLMVVADPDQMIYGWRDADPKRLDALATTLGRTVTLTGNWRSTTAVCQLAATLRTGQRPPDMSVVEHPTAPTVLLLPTRFGSSGRARHITTGRDLLEVFCEYAATHDIAATDCLVTARSRSTLPGTVARSGGNTTVRLARAWMILHSGTAAPDRTDHACRTAARVLLRYWYPDSSGSLEAACATHDLPLRDLMRHAYAFLHSLPAPESGWPRVVNRALKSWPRPADASPRATVGQLRAAPGKTTPVDDGPRPRVDNVHQVKGDEHDAVLLLLPDEDLAARWCGSNAGADETLRVWYVAVTRARRLVALAVQQSEANRLHDHLDKSGVPCTLL